MAKRIRRGLVLPDIHCPYHDPKAIDAICAYAATESWDFLVQLGDHMDFPFISKFVQGMPGLTAGHSFRADAEVGRGVLDQILGAVRKKNPRCKAVMTGGNHEYRVDRYRMEHPEMTGLLDAPDLLGLKKRRVEWVPYWAEGKVYRIGDAMFGHGRYTNVHHAKKNAAAYGGRFYGGHTHDVQEHTEPLHGSGSVMAKSLGCLCLEPDWMQGVPNKWQQAFGVFYFFPDNTHQEFTVKLTKPGRFVSPEGHVYQA